MSWGGPDYSGLGTPPPEKTGEPNPGPGGGRVKAPLRVENVQKSGANYDKVTDRIYDLTNTIDPDCLGFLQSGGNDFGPYVSDLLGNDLLAVADFAPAYAAFTNSEGTTLPPGTAAIVVNNLSAFFSSAYTVDQGGIKGGTTKAQAFILLHEFGHALEAKGFLPDKDKSEAGKSNDRLIESNCAKTLEQFR